MFLRAEKEKDENAIKMQLQENAGKGDAEQQTS